MVEEEEEVEREGEEMEARLPDVMMGEDVLAEGVDVFGLVDDKDDAEEVEAEVGEGVGGIAWTGARD